MEFWERQMPRGMFLRSSWDASSIADADSGLTLDRYQSELGTELSRPVPLDSFLDYARWFQQRAVPDVDERRVESVHGSGAGRGFRLALDDGEVLDAARVVVATGPGAFQHVPVPLARLPRDLALHSAGLCDLRPFAGRRVAVIGAGQSATESAVLLSEAGADVRMIARAPQIRWLRSSGWLHARTGITRQLLYPPSDVGPPGLNQITARPRLWRTFPRRTRAWIAYRSIRPAATAWLEPRAAFETKFGASVVSADTAGEQVRLVLDDGTADVFDRVVTATGYRLDLERLKLIAPELRAEIRTIDDYPRLGRGLESSVVGLHFAGVFAARSFGPLMCFVAGTGYAGRALARSIAGSPRAAPLRRHPVTATAPTPQLGHEP
jgi:hypothetical protein